MARKKNQEIKRDNLKSCRKEVGKTINPLFDIKKI